MGLEIGFIRKEKSKGKAGLHPVRNSLPQEERSQGKEETKVQNSRVFRTASSSPFLPKDFSNKQKGKTPAKFHNEYFISHVLCKISFSIAYDCITIL